MRLRALCLVFSLLAPAFCTDAQVFDMDRDREPVVSLDGLWRFQPCDDPRWADPAFDDSKWPLISSTRSWSEQGYKNMAGTAWYRAKVQLPSGEDPLAIYVPVINTSYQLFVDGKLIGGKGGMPPHERVDMFHPTVYLLPPFDRQETRVLSISFRIWQSPSSPADSPGGLSKGTLIGKRDLVQQWGAMKDHEKAWNYVLSDSVLGLLQTLTGLGAFALFILRRQEKEYLWFAMMVLLGTAATSFMDSFIYFHSITGAWYEISFGLLAIGSSLAGMAFYFRLLGGKRNWLFWLSVTSILSSYLVTLLNLTMGGLTASVRNLTWGFLAIAPVIWLASLLLRRAYQGLPDARLLLGPVLLQVTVGLALIALQFEEQGGWSPVPLGWLNYSWQWPFPFTLSNAVDFSFLIAMLAILVHRFTRSRRHEERLLGEFEAARTVQQVLVPEAIPAIPGFKIETVYKPFSEVSGDFFQVLNTRCSDGSSSAVVVIGDVSGKGMPAAMTVSLLVGTVRTLAHFTSSPGAILAAMNQRMLGRMQHGFTTCLVLRADPDGKCTVANAGHPAPYRKGAELTLENGLPLGLSDSSTYPEVTFQLVEGESITFITDGVVEARAKSGELFGFERTAEISTLSADFIALTAQAFGQDDDITVLTLSRVAVGEPSVVEVAAPMLSPSPA
jgi:hypothetical protein